MARAGAGAGQDTKESEPACLAIYKRPVVAQRQLAHPMRHLGVVPKEPRQQVRHYGAIRD